MESPTLRPKVLKLERPNSGSWEKLNLSSLQRFLALKSDLHRRITEFLAKLHLLSEFKMGIKDEDEKFFIEREEIRPNDQEKPMREKIDLVPLLSGSMKELQKHFLIFQENAYKKFDMLSIYTKNQEAFDQEIEKMILDFALLHYREIAILVTSSLEKWEKECEQEFKVTLKKDDTFKKNPTVAAHVEGYRYYKKTYVGKLHEGVEKRFWSELSEVFVAPYRRKLCHLIKEEIIDNILFKDLMGNRAVFMGDIYQKLDKLFHGYWVEGDIIEVFDIKILKTTENIGTLFKIILLTEYQTDDDEQKQAYIETLERVFSVFMENYPELQEYLERARRGIKDPEIREKMNDMLEKEAAAWSQEIRTEENLFALWSVFLAFNFATEKGLDRSYNCQMRHMLKCVFRNLKNGEMQFTNFQVLCCIESLMVKYATSLDISMIKMNSSTSVIIKDTLDQISNTTVKSIAEHLEHEGQLEKLASKLKSDIVKPEKFFFEKISDPKVRSKSVIICVSGFTSEDYAKQGEWKDVCTAFPDTEIIAVNWKSNALRSIGGSIWDSFKEKLKDGFNLKNGGMAAYFAGTDAWSKTYQQAMISGVYLAHFLAKTDLFRGYVVNLMGFSLGTILIMSCIYELERMGHEDSGEKVNSRDIVYDVLLMGGVAHIQDFHRSMLKAIGNKIINCYCSTDRILQYLLSHVHEKANPVGLGPITWADSKVVNLDVTHISDGHLQYRNVLREILTRTDFNEDLGYMLKKE